MDKKRVTVIGGGLGGMSAAISLARHPEYDITIIEKNDHLGGKLNVMVKDGFSFDLGPSILTMPHIFEALFTMHNRDMKDYLDLVPVRPHWRNFFEDGTIIDLTARIEDMAAQEAVSEEDVRELQDFYDYTSRIYDFTNRTYFENQIEGVLAAVKHYPMHRILKDSDYFHTMHEAVTRYVSNPYLIDILDYFIKYVGSSAYDAPAILNVLPYVQWAFDLWYVKDGMYNLAKGLAALIAELGITVMTNTEVTGAIKGKKGLDALILDKERRYESDLVVSNMEVIPFYRQITKESPKRILPYEKKYGPACSGFALHLGVDRTYDILRHHNFFYSTDLKKNFDNIFHNHALSKDPTIYLVAPMKTDPSLGPKGAEIIKILPHVPTNDPDRTLKGDFETFRTDVLDKLERLGLTDLRKHVVTEELWLPETIESTYYSNQGAIYGVVSDRKVNKGFKTPKHSKYYDNLYFVGGSVNPGGGMPMVVLSGQQVVDQIRRTKR
ncbi:MAG: phytoene desaturase family protein [Acholeplasmataceae bacterium]